MLTFNFRRVFKARGIERPFSFLVKAGYSDNFATRVVNCKIKRMNLTDVEALCCMLNCTPNDVLEWIPDKSQSNTENHPLSSLMRTESASQLNQLLNAIPMSRISEIEDLIKNELKK
ncbi:MAG: helix-turn-helix domain-containing protein [Bacteroidales bacterium]